MPRLIKINKAKELRVTHKECGAVIGYFPTEVNTAQNYDYRGGSETWYYITCPNCNKDVEVPHE
jgi:hypothetical protein